MKPSQNKPLSGLIQFFNEKGIHTNSEIATMIDVHAAQLATWLHADRIQPVRKSSWLKIIKNIYELGYRQGSEIKVRHSPRRC